MLSKHPIASRAHGSGSPLHSPCAPGYRFGAVEVDFHTGELRKSGLRIKIQDQPMQVLSILLRHPGEIVTREEFRSLLWPADTFVDFEHGLNSAVKRLRDALDDDPEHPRLIETIPRHGYRFIAPVTEIPPIPAVSEATAVVVDGRAAQNPSVVEQAKSAAVFSGHGSRRRSHLHRWTLALVVGLVVVWACFVAIHERSIHARQVPPPAPVTLVVLPFRDLSGDPSQRFMAEGVTQELITHLAKMEPARVVVSARAVAGADQPDRKAAAVIGSELGVAYVLDGSTRLQGSHLRVSVQLIKVSDQSYVWTESYDTTVDDILLVQAEVARQIARSVRDKLIR